MARGTAGNYDKGRIFCQESWIARGLRETKRLLNDTSIEVILLGIASIAFAAYLSYGHELARSHKVPLAFSEITSLERQAKDNRKEAGAMTQYYAKLSDAVMKILEAWNISWEKNPGNNLYEFAKELKERTTKDSDYGSKHTYNINDILEAMPQLARDASRTMAGFSKNLSLIETLNQELCASWTESHADHYRTEHYMATETYRDSTGNLRTRIVNKTRSVYDHTTHTYTYYPEHGEEAYAILAQLKNNIKELGWPENLSIVTKINKPNQDAIVISRAIGEKTPNLSNAEMLKIVNAWNHGSTYNQNRQRITSAVNSIPDFNDRWGSAKNRARSTRYDTHFHSDSGPEECRAANRILEETRGLERGVTEIISGISHAGSQAPGLTKAIRDYIDALTSAESTGVKIEPKKTQKEIIQTVQSWYSANIKGGLDIDMFRWHCILLWGLFGAIAGAGLGAAVDSIGSRFRLYYNHEKRKSSVSERFIYN